MTFAAVITLVIIGLAIVFFATELIPADLVALLAMVALVLFGVISPEEGIEGFSNPATITVAFMFVISAAILKTGAMQMLALRLSDLFRFNFKLGMFLMLVLVAFISAFINNTPVVAVFIPVVLQIAHSSGQSPAKMLIPLSFASIFGGTCTLIGTSTNLLVNGMAIAQGLPAIGMFDLTLMGLIFLSAGVGYLLLIGIRMLPETKAAGEMNDRYNLRNYLAEIQLLSESAWIGKRIMDSALVKELGMDIIEIRRQGEVFSLPPGDFVLRSDDVLKVRCDVEKLKSLKDRERIAVQSSLIMGDNDLKGTQSTLVELVITVNSDFADKNLREMDFRRSFRAIPLGILHRDEMLSENLYEVKLKPGDVILAEVKTHYVEELKKMQQMQSPPFVVLSEDHVKDFDRKRFGVVVGITLLMILLAATGVVNILTGAIGAVLLMVLLGCISMKELYESVNWKIVFLMAGALSFGLALHKTGLDRAIADKMIGHLGIWGPIAVLSGIYLLTSFFTEIMSNTAAAALSTPIAISAALAMSISPTPFLMAVMFAASSSFMTPIGYQTNTMVYGTGHYRFTDFLKVGTPLNLLLWLIATLTIPLIYPF